MGSNGQASAVTGFARVSQDGVGLKAKPAPVPCGAVRPGRHPRPRLPLNPALYGPKM